LKCERIEKHTTHKGDTADEGTIIEELHNRILKQDEKIARLENEKAALAEKISRNYLGELLKAVNMLKEGLTEKKSKLEKIERGLELIVSTLAAINNE
ncbi:MAG: hypothetical protein UHJ41_08895, partial [Bacteroidaceae bacterium]|nr:hypothetical protein [Bacteroidaceae bacterium]